MARSPLPFPLKSPPGRRKYFKTLYSVGIPISDDHRSWPYPGYGPESIPPSNVVRFPMPADSETAPILDENLRVLALEKDHKDLKETLNNHTQRIGHLEGHQEALDEHVFPAIREDLKQIKAAVTREGPGRLLIMRLTEPEALKYIAALAALLIIAAFGLTARYGEAEVGGGRRYSEINLEQTKEVGTPPT